MDNAPKPPRSNADKDFEDIRPEMSLDEADRRARIEYLRSLTGHKKPKKRGWLKAVIAIVVIVLVLGAGAYYWFVMRKPAATKTTTTSQKAPDAATAQNVPTKHYDSSTFNLGLDYPNTWKVTDAGDGKLTVASPSGTFKTANGTTDGQVIVTIQSKQNSLPAFKSGNAVAARDSEKIAYLKPTPNQRAQTYLTHMSYAGTAAGNLDGVYITGDLGYQKGQAVPQTDIVQGDPLVTVTFAKCDGTTCPTDPTTAKLTIPDTSWADSNALIKAATTILTSLTIQ